MTSATLKAIECTEMMVLWCLIEKKSSLDLALKKRGIFNKIPFLHKAFHRRFWKGITSFISENIILDQLSN